MDILKKRDQARTVSVAALASKDGGFKKEGWLTKKGKRMSSKRYYVLSSTNLTWFNQPLGKVMGSIDLRNFGVQLAEPGPEEKESTTFRIYPLDKEVGSKSYMLQCKSFQETKEWLDTIKLAKNSVVTPQKKFESKVKGGWLEKKGKKRWFVLRDNVLYWFSKEQSPYSDFLKEAQCNGYLDLRLGCKVQQEASKPHSFTISSTISKSSYTMTARTDQEMHEWMEVIDNSIHSAINARVQMELGCDIAGWLIKKGQQRFFVLMNGKLFWYLSEKDRIEGRPKGQLVLAGCDVMDSQHITNRFTMLISATNGKKYELQMKSQDELQQWIEATHNAIEASDKKTNTRHNSLVKMQGWLQVNNKMRFFILTEEVLMWFVESPRDLTEVAAPEGPKVALNANNLLHNLGHVSLVYENTKNEPIGNVTLAGCTVVSKSDDYTFAIHTSTGKPHFLTARSIQEMNRWSTALREAVARATLALSTSKQKEASGMRLKQKSGWLVKLGKPRWFLVINDILMWFEKEQSSDLSRHAKGNLSLSGCSVSSGKALTGEENVIILASEQGRTYHLTAQSKEEAEEWVAFLHDCILRANDTKMAINLNSHDDKFRCGWVTKRGKKRWLVLKNNFLMWFIEEQSEGVQGVVKGSIALAGCTVSQAKDAESPTMIVQTSLGNVYKLTVQTQPELTDWISGIQRSIDDANQISEKHYIIAQKNEKELIEIILAPNLVIPSTLTKCYQSDEVISALIQLFYAEDAHFRLLNHILYRELVLAAERSETTLFRGDSVATKATRAYFRLVGSQYLKDTLAPFVKEVIAQPNDSFELDPIKASKTDDLKLNQQKMLSLTAAILETVLNSERTFPVEMRQFLNNLKRLVENIFPSSRLVAINAFVFLRWMGPAVFSPEGFGLVEEAPPPLPRRTLILVAKILQAIGNGVPFQKEEYMIPFNEFVEKSIPRIEAFFEKISEIPNDVDNPIKQKQDHQKEKIRNLSVIVRYLDLSSASIEKEMESDPRMQAIGSEAKQKCRDQWRRLQAILSEM